MKENNLIEIDCVNLGNGLNEITAVRNVLFGAEIKEKYGLKVCLEYGVSSIRVNRTIRNPGIWFKNELRLTHLISAVPVIVKDEDLKAIVQYMKEAGKILVDLKNKYKKVVNTNEVRKNIKTIKI